VLQHLTLKNNLCFAGVVRTAAFQSQQSLESLDLSHNLLVTLEARSLAGLSHLHYLYLSHNRLTRFNSDIFHGKKTNLLFSLSLSLSLSRLVPTFADRGYKYRVSVTDLFLLLLLGRYRGLHTPIPSLEGMNFDLLTKYHILKRWTKMIRTHMGKLKI
jgi:hypothetical protein